MWELDLLSPLKKNDGVKIVAIPSYVEEAHGPETSGGLPRAADK